MTNRTVGKRMPQEDPEKVLAELEANQKARRERPIIFAAESVRAILAGKKCQTRRVVKPQPAEWLAGHLDSGFRTMKHQYRDVWGAATVVGNVSACHSSNCIRCPFGEVGNRLWVRN